MRTSSNGIARKLTEELEVATAEFNKMQRVALEIVRYAPCGIPLPDGQARILRSWREVRVAFERYHNAVKAYRNFLYRIVPDGEDHQVP